MAIAECGDDLQPALARRRRQGGPEGLISLGRGAIAKREARDAGGLVIRQQFGDGGR